MRRAMLWMMTALALTLTGAGMARAEDKDCARAGNARVQLLCRDPALAAANKALDAAYDQALKPLSPAGRETLGEGQRSWIGFVETRCGLGGREVSAAAAGDEAPAACLGRYIELRRRQLGEAVATGGGIVVSRVERFKIRPSGDRYRFVTADIAYPRIDVPPGSSEKNWNALMAQSAWADAAEAKGATDLWRDYRIVTLDRDVISADFSVYSYGHGAAHGVTVHDAVTWLRHDERPLVPADLFDAQRDWQGALAKLAFDALAAKRQKQPNDYWAEKPEQLAKIVADPRRWTIERDGLGLRFQEYEVGPYVLGAPKVVLPWTALKPYLAAKPAFAIPPG